MCDESTAENAEVRVVSLREERADATSAGAAASGRASYITWSSKDKEELDTLLLSFGERAGEGGADGGGGAAIAICLFFWVVNCLDGDPPACLNFLGSTSLAT